MRITARVLRWFGIGVVALPLLLFLTFIGWSFVFFKSGRFYSGDGRYVHPGSHGATFQVAFPELDMAVRQSITYNFTRLAPTIGWTVGVRPTAPTSEAIIRLTLTNEEGEIVFDERVRVQPDTHFATSQGKTREVPIGSDGSVRIEPLGLKADGGWGTHFQPRWTGDYSLRVEVVAASSRSKSLAVVVMEAYTGGP